MIQVKRNAVDEFIPRELTDDVFRALEGFDNVCYFRWDLQTDSQFTAWMPQDNPFFAPPIDNIFDFLYNTNVIHPKDIFMFEDFWHHIHSGEGRPANGSERRELEMRILCANQKDYLWAEINLLTYFAEAQPTTVFASVRNINSQKEHQLELLRDAEVDKLTGFFNKHATERHIQEYLRLLPPEQAAPIFFIIDADGFKTINDTFGHLFGDGVLADMALGIEKHFRNGDILGRIGGDEFVVLAKEMPNSTELIGRKCQELVRSLQRSYQDEQQSIPFSVSVGVARYTEHCTTFKKLFAHADLALYNAKAQGKNTYTIYKPNLMTLSVPVRTEIDSNDSADFQQRAFKDNMIEFIFRLLYETKNSDATISLSLGLLGKQFNLDRISIEIYNRRTSSLKIAYEWLSPNGVSRRKNDAADRQNKARESINTAISARYKASAFGTLSLCADTAALEADTHEAFASLHCRSFAHCKITRGTEDIGVLSFETANLPHHYGEDELNYLSTFAGLLGTVLLTRESDTALAQKNRRFVDIIDHMQEMIYVIDKKTHELLFFNQALRQALPETTSAEACYYRFHKFTAPCPDCPASRLSENGLEYIERTINSWGAPTQARAFNIEWSPGQKAALIIVEPF